MSDDPTTETAKTSNQELVAELRRCEDWYGFSGLSGRVEALLAERDALQEQLLGGGRAAYGTASLPSSCPHRWTVDGINIVCGNGCGTALYMGYTERDTTPKFGPDGRQTWDHIELHAKNLAHALAETLNASAASTTTDAQRPSPEVELDSLRGRVAVLEAALRDAAEIALNRDDVYGDPLLAIRDRLAGEFADEPLGAVLAGGDAAAEEVPR